MATGKYKGLNNQAYWNKRSQELQDTAFKNLKAPEKLLKMEYLKAFDEVQESLSLFYTKYAADNAITYNQAIRQLNSYDLSNYGTRMKTLKERARITNNPYVIAEMEKLTQMATVSRMSGLLNEIDAKLLLLGHTQQLTMEDILSKTYESIYYQTAYQMAVGSGIGMSFSRINHRAVLQAINYPWSGDMFSNRIWTNRAKLVTELRQTLTNGLIKGSSSQRMSRELKKKMNSNYKNTLRLINTEMAHVVTEATVESYKEMGLESYIFNATFDNRTSQKCQDMSGRVFKVIDKVVGENAPPLHPSCRSSIAPHHEDFVLIGKRVRDEAGNNIIVDANMTYDQWAAKYIQK